MYLNIPQEDLDKKRIDRFLLMSLATALLIGTLLIAGALLMPESLQARRSQPRSVSIGPIQNSLTMINSMSRMQDKKSDGPIAKVGTPEDSRYTPAQLLNMLIKPLVSCSSLSL